MVGDSLDVEEMPVADVVGRRVSPERAAAKGERALEAGRHTAAALSARRIHENAARWHLVAKAFDQTRVPAVNDGRMPGSRVPEELPASQQTLVRADDRGPGEQRRHLFCNAG